MTYLELLNKEYPELIDETSYGGAVGCPHQYFKVDAPIYCPSINKNGDFEKYCSLCWGREISTKTHIKDSGDRTKFESGAVRDMRKGKGRCDLMPLDVAAELLNDVILREVSMFTNDYDPEHLYYALKRFALVNYDDSVQTMLLEVSKHFEDGAEKYGENNWQKGIPVNCYIDSAIRHYLKWLRLDQDEPHDRAFVWNIMCCIWTYNRLETTTEAEEGENNA